MMIQLVKNIIRKLNMKKIFVFLLFVVLCFSFSGCSLSDVSFFAEEASIELMNNENEVSSTIGEKIDYYCKINADDDFPVQEIQCFSENESIATAEYRHILWETELHYYINGVSAGETYIYFSTPDGKTQSEKLKVTVLSQTNSESEVFTAQATTQPKAPCLINTISLQTGQTSSRFGFSLSGLNGESKDNVEIVSENSLVATVLCDKLYSQEFIYFTITGVRDGKTYIYLRNKDGAVLSERIQVAVTSSGISETTTKESEPSVTSDNDPVFITETTTTTIALNEIPETVYITPTGKKYHYKASCAGKNAEAVSLSEAKESYEPCKRCVRE